MHKNLSMLQLGVISIVALCSLLIGLVVYYDSLLVDLQESTCQMLDEVLQQEQNNFTKKLTSDKETLKGFAELIALIADSGEALKEKLDIMTTSTDFEYMAFAETSGISVNNEGEVVDLGDRDYFHQALAGATVISEPVTSKVRGVNIIAVATPVWRNEAIEGVLVGTFEAEKLNELFMTSFDGYGYTYVATNEGELVAKTDSIHVVAGTSNLYDLFGQADFYKNDSYKTMQENLVAGQGGHTQYRLNDQERLMHYAKLPINQWNIFAVVSPAGVTVTANHILMNAILLAIGLTSVYIGLLGYNYSSQKKLTKELTRMAYVDDVTGSRSFSKFKIDATRLIKDHPEINYRLFKVDIEKFKLLNEIYSMETGDKVLRAAAEALDGALDKNLDAFGRIHADEFVILSSYPTDGEESAKREKFETHFLTSCSALTVFKIVIPEGRYKLEKGETDFAQIYEKVNFAHRLAKSSPLRVVDFDGKVKELAIREKEIEMKMEDALANGDFQMYLQPKYRLKDEKMVGAEALVRWHALGEGMIYPDEFIPLFEQNGFITKIDFTMFEQACQVLEAWIGAGVEPITLSVNFSRLHLVNPNFVEILAQMADDHQVPHHLLEIELTENVMFENTGLLVDILAKIHQAGFTLSMDDFGSGYSSLGLLKDIPVDVIKIDKAFFDEAKDMTRAKAVIASVVEMAQKLNISTVAEGVETQDQVQLLKELGCEMVQGYYYAKPMPAQELEIKLLRNILAGKQ